MMYGGELGNNVSNGLNDNQPVLGEKIMKLKKLVLPLILSLLLLSLMAVGLGRAQGDIQPAPLDWKAEPQHSAA